MATYPLTTFDGSHEFTVLDHALEQTQVPITLVGTGTRGYGKSVAQNFLNLVENYAVDPVAKPDVFAGMSAKAVTGMIYYDKSLKRLKVNIGPPGEPNWTMIGPSAIEPTNPQTGDLWFDPVTHTLKAYDVDHYLTIGPMSFTGDVTGSGSPVVTLTLVNSGATAGTYDRVTVDAKGRVTNGQKVRDGSTMPPGVVLSFAGTAPAGWLPCDGSAVSRTTYADLFAAIGTRHGAGDGSTTFNVPNMQGCVPLGAGTYGPASFASGARGGALTHTLNSSEVPSLSVAGTTATVSLSHAHTGSISFDGAHVHHTTSGVSASPTPYYVRVTYTMTNSSDPTPLPSPLGPGPTGPFQPDTSFTSDGAPFPSGTYSANAYYNYSDGLNTDLGAGAHNHTVSIDAASTSHEHSFSATAVGGGQAHSIMQPYVVLDFYIKT